MGRKRSLTKFPVARIKKIMQADEDVGKIATSTPILVGKALECLMSEVLHDSAMLAVERHTKTVSPQHLKHIINSRAHFDFLRPTVAAVSTLDDPNAPTSRRGKRLRAAASEAGPAFRAPPVPRVKRTRTPQPPATIAPAPESDAGTSRDKSMDSQTTESERVPMQISSNPAPEPPISQSTVLPIPAPNNDDDEDDEDYDECDEDEDDNTPSTVAADDRSPQSKRRVSVQALLS